ncbi:recombinase family protein [Actinomadura sp. NPDC047616]|uniref:recombinase family protein n=1 Tax=Actinomadura sp. NPDC047616 TaxID=3155914 RepID=UPI0033DEF26F
MCLKVFEEKTSGKLATQKRPALLEALSHPRRDMLTVQEVDRLDRDLLEWLIALNDLFQGGIAVKVLEGIAAGEHTERSLVLALAEDRRRDVVRKTKDGLEAVRHPQTPPLIIPASLLEERPSTAPPAVTVDPK